MRGFAPRFECLGISATDSHQTSDFCACLQLIICKGTSGLAYEISPMYRESLISNKLREVLEGLCPKPLNSLTF
jgi:hypothetical protein